jgi:hypothetical protein
MSEPLQPDQIPTGMSAIFVVDGRVIAHVTDFNRSTYGGFTLQESQEHRVRDKLATAVVRELASPLLWRNLNGYDCQRILDKIGGTVHVLPIGGPGKP